MLSLNNVMNSQKSVHIVFMAHSENDEVEHFQTYSNIWSYRRIDRAVELRRESCDEACIQHIAPHCTDYVLIRTHHGCKMVDWDIRSQLKQRKKALSPSCVVVKFFSVA